MTPPDALHPAGEPHEGPLGPSEPKDSAMTNPPGSKEWWDQRQVAPADAGIPAWFQLTPSDIASLSPGTGDVGEWRMVPVVQTDEMIRAALAPAELHAELSAIIARFEARMDHAAADEMGVMSRVPVRDVRALIDTLRTDQATIEGLRAEVERIRAGWNNAFTRGLEQQDEIKALRAEVELWRQGDMLLKAEFVMMRDRAQSAEATITALRAGLDKAKEALADVNNPVERLRRLATERGCKLSGEAYSIGNSLSFVQQIAHQALAEIAAAEGKAS